jgi:hypothetical protein
MNMTREQELDLIDEIMGEFEAEGICEKVRDAAGNVMMRPDSEGTPRIVWRNLGAPASRARH